MASKPNLYAQVLVELTRAALEKTGETEFLALMDSGATYRLAIDPTPQGELHFLIVNGVDSPVVFTAEVVNAALKVERNRPTQ